MTIEVQIVEKQWVADNIVHLILEKIDQQPLPEFTAGAHIDLHIDSNTIRQYSLLPSQQASQYEIAILKEVNGRGGSLKVHEQLKTGDRVKISAPRNHFPLEDAQHSILIAGGIGITPILAMADELTRKQASFELHYCSRSQTSAAFYDDISRGSLNPFSHFYFDDQDVKLNRILFAHPTQEKRIFVCGPEGFINFVRDSALEMGWSKSRVHYELFQKSEQDNTGHGRPFNIKLADQDVLITVGENETALEALERRGYEVPYSCEQGICGTCALEVVAGIPDHQDMYLTDKEREQNTRFVTCCSRAISDELTLRV